VETALANASRVLPLVTSAHLASASNHAFWPEIYDNMPIVLGSEASPYSDTPTPKCFGTVSPLDPQLFSTIAEHVGDLLENRANPKYSPIEVAQWLEDYTTASSQALASARVQATSHTSPAFRRIEEDVLIQDGLGRFFAAKLRSGVLFEIYTKTGNAEAGKLALAKYQEARSAWASMADRANKVYQADVTYGNIPMRRGNWSARVAGIDADVAAMEKRLQTPPAGSTQNVASAIGLATGKANRPSVHCVHTQPASFHPGQPLALSLSASADAVQLYYRHVNQGERWVSTDMQRSQAKYTATIPGDYTNSVYSLQYYFVLRRGTDAAWFFPAFNATLSNQPYYAIAFREN
jgi:hypothetical protein